MTPDEMNDFELKHKISRNLDRAHLRLNPIYRDDILSSASDDEIDGVNKVTLKKWLRPTTNTTVGKMVRFLYNNTEEEVLFEEFKEGSEYTESDDRFINNITSGSGIGTQYGKVWIASNNYQIIRINPNIQAYIDSLN